MPTISPHVSPAASARPAPHLPTLEQIAREELIAANGNRDEAIVTMRERLLDDAALREALVAPIVHQACATAIGTIIRTRRARVWKGPSAAQSRQRFKTAAAVNRLSLMNFRLPSGKRLGDATGAEVREAAKFYLTQGRDMTTKGRWLLSIADTIPADGVVVRLLRARQLQALQTKAEKAQ